MNRLAAALAEVRPIRARVLEGVPHGFLTREGGVSTGTVSGLQFGVGAGDDPGAVAENRRRGVEAVLPGAVLAMPYQVHSPDAVIVDRAVEGDERPRADALVTATPGLLLGVVTADCAPVLLADRQAGVVAAVHAGWRGAVGGVIESAVAKMLELGARTGDIFAAIGPAIAQPNYEVGPEMRGAFASEDEAFFAQGRGDRLHFDLEGYVASRLRQAGVTRVEALGLDTYGDAGRFYSFRRSTHAGEADYGRQAALIGLP